MGETDRGYTRILVVEPDAMEREGVCAALRSLGFGAVFASPDLAGASRLITKREVAIVIFGTTKQNASPFVFCREVALLPRKVIAIPVLSETSAALVLDYVRVGASGFLLKPTTTASIEHVVGGAIRGEGLSGVVLESDNRGEFLAAVVAAKLDKLSVQLRGGLEKARQREAWMELRHLMKFAMASHEGGTIAFLETLYASFMQLSEENWGLKGQPLERLGGELR